MANRPESKCPPEFVKILILKKYIFNFFQKIVL